MNILVSRIMFAAAFVLWPTFHSAFADTPQELAAARDAYRQAQLKLNDAEVKLSNHEQAKPPVGRDKLKADLTTVESRIPAKDPSPATAKIQANLDAANARIKANNEGIITKTLQTNTLDREIRELDSKIGLAHKSQAIASPEQRAAAENHLAQNVEPLANQLKAMMPKLAKHLASEKRGVPTLDEARSFARGPFLVASEDLKKLARLRESVEATDSTPQDLEAFDKDNDITVGVGGKENKLVRIDRKIDKFTTKARVDVQDLIEKLAEADRMHKEKLKELYPDDDAREHVASLSGLQAQRASKQEKYDKEKRLINELIDNAGRSVVPKLLAEADLKASQPLQTQFDDLKNNWMRLTRDLDRFDTWEKDRITYEKEKNLAQTKLDQARGHLNATAKEGNDHHWKRAKEENATFNELTAKAGSEDEKREWRRKLDDRLKHRQEELEAIQAGLKNEADDAKKAGRNPDPQTQKLLGDLKSNLDRIRGRRDKLNELGMTRPPKSGSQIPPKTYDGPPPVGQEESNEAQGPKEALAGPWDATQLENAAVGAVLGPDVVFPGEPGSQDGPGPVDAPQLATDVPPPAGPGVRARRPVDLSGAWHCKCPATWTITKVRTNNRGAVTYSVFIQHDVEEWSASLGGTFDPATRKLSLSGRDHSEQRNVFAYELTYDPASGTLGGESTNQSQGGAGRREDLQRQ